MNTASWVVLAIVALAMDAALYRIFADRKKSSCHSDCSSCSAPCSRIKEDLQRARKEMTKK